MVEFSDLLFGDCLNEFGEDFSKKTKVSVWLQSNRGNKGRCGDMSRQGWAIDS